jgi:hypothetical protein
MTLFLRKQHAHDLIEGRSPGPWSEDDYAVVDGVCIGRIYLGGGQWRWLLHVHCTGQNSGAAGTLSEAKIEIAERYRAAK